jgi:dipeptidyl aminopeptidase/acylaminoacyl peptidase
MKITLLFLFLLAYSIIFAADPSVPLIPRKLFMGNAERDKPFISPGGTRIAYQAPSSEGVMNIWVRTIGKSDDRMVTNDKSNGIFHFLWGFNDQDILFLQDNQGDENNHLKSVDLESGKVRDLTPYQDVRATNLLKDDQHPEEVMIGLNKRDKSVFDMYRVNLRTAAVTLEATNPGDVIGWTTDENFQIRAATAFQDDLSTAIRVRDAVDKPWRNLLVTAFERTPFLGQFNGGSLVIGFNKDGKTLYAVTSANSDTTQLVGIDVANGKILKVLAEDPRADLWDVDDAYQVLTDKRTGAPQAAAFNYLKPEYKSVDPAFESDLKFLKSNETGIFRIVNGDYEDRHWIVRYLNDVKPSKYFLYTRNPQKLELLIDPDSRLSKYTLAQMKPVQIKARDGMDLTGYLTLPQSAQQQNLPLVLIPHGGPWYRDEWGFDSEVQWLANRGYATLKVNFRGSTGFGLKYMNAGTGQWCTGSMQHDLTDAVRWAIAQKIADPKRIGIYGGSYGGYATLCGLTMTPELYVAGVAAVGPSDVGYLLSSFPPYWKPVKKRWIRRIGIDAEKDSEANKKISPLFHVENIRVPVLIAHGANDPRVKQEASDRIVKAMREKKLPVTYLVYPDEGHGFYREPNILDFVGRLEEFLAQHLKGRLEPRQEIAGTSVQVR